MLQNMRAKMYRLGVMAKKTVESGASYEDFADKTQFFMRQNGISKDPALIDNLAKKWREYTPRKQ